jgi:cation diffusion facilitator family transporter
MAVLGSIDFKARKKAAWISFFTSLAVLSLKVYAYQQTHSVAVLSDALESVVNVLTAVVALFVITYSAQPADEEHPYGHGKAEYFSSAFEGGLIFFAAAMIIFESIRGLSREGHLQQLELGAAYIGIATVLNLTVGIYLNRVGNREKSETLSASGAHLLSDVKTTVGVIFGILLVKWTGWEKLDALLAIIVGLHLLYEGYKIITRSIKGLIDAVDESSLELLSKLIKQYRRPGIIEIHHLRILRSGSFHHIDGHLVVPEFWDVAKAHELVHAFEDKVVNEYPYDGEFAFHLDPCQRAFCKKCDMKDCPIRVAPFEEIFTFSVNDITHGPHKC